jgi:polyisoprenoid-binding protein YceI
MTVMKTKLKQTIILATLLFLSKTAFTQQRLVSNNTHIRFFSTTPAEDIESNNYASTSTINLQNGNVVFSVPMQSFEFQKSLMQRHFNQERFLHTKEFPTTRLVGKITNLSEIDFSKDGTYNTIVEGELTIRGITNKIKEPGTITVKGGTVEAKSKFFVTLADYGITFGRGKPSTNIADKVEVTVVANYEKELHSR